MTGARAIVSAFESGGVIYARCPFCEALVATAACEHFSEYSDVEGIRQMEFQRATITDAMAIAYKSAAAATVVWIILASASVAPVLGTTSDVDERSIRTEQRVTETERRIAGVEGLIERVARLEVAVNASSQYQLAVGSGVAVLIAQQLLTWITKRK